MPTDLLVRPAVLADAEAIAEVHVAAWHETYTGLMPQAVIDVRTVANRTERWRGILGAEPQTQAVFVAEVEDGIVGFAAVGRARTVGDFADAELNGLYLLAAQHGRGVGHALFDVGAAAARGLGARAIGLWALTNNVRACRFYEKAGCVAVATRDEVLDGERIAEVGYRLDL
jgi:GNAT superfamily N-acetyltransferase